MTDWVRLWHDMPTDPKWRTIARKSGQPLPCVIALFNLLMVNASGNADERGTLRNWDDEDAAAALDMDPEAVSAIMQAMQGKVIEGTRLTGWEKRQPKREDDNAASRKRAQRERERTAADDVSRNVTHGHAPETETETDTETDITPLTPQGGEQPDYAFAGKVIRLNKRDLGQWSKTYHAIPDITAELSSLDAWFLKYPAKQKDWFHTTAGALNRKHQEALAARRAAGPVQAVVGI